MIAREAALELVACLRCRLLLGLGAVGLLSLVGCRTIPTAASNIFCFSDVHRVQESGDIVGTELLLRISGETVTGILKYYEGFTPISSDVTGTTRGGVVEVVGAIPGGRVEITGARTPRAFTGKILVKLERQDNFQQIALPSVSCP